MPLSADAFHARVRAAADPQGRLPLSRMTGWETFPFEPADLRSRPLAPPALPEPPRSGENGVDCPACAAARPAVWADLNWRLFPFGEPSGAPLILMLEPQRHHDLTDLPDHLAAELGRLVVHISRAVESLPHVARAHVARWGDGGAHLHVFFLARPAGFPQLRGTCLAVWDDLLPPVPRQQRDADAAAVGHAVAASYGGTAG